MAILFLSFALQNELYCTSIKQITNFYEIYRFTLLV